MPRCGQKWVEVAPFAFNVCKCLAIKYGGRFAAHAMPCHACRPMSCLPSMDSCTRDAWNLTDNAYLLKYLPRYLLTYSRYQHWKLKSMPSTCRVLIGDHGPRSWSSNAIVALVPSRCPATCLRASTEIGHKFVSLCPFRPVLDSRCVASTLCPGEHGFDYWEELWLR